jgi:long-chain fatty acid transport protein
MTNLKKLVTTIILAVPTMVSAQGFQVNLQGQVQQGMGTAGTALIQDGAALFFNPGGAAFVKKNSIDLGMTATIANGQFLDKNTGTVNKTTSPVSTPFTAYAIFGKDSCTKKGMTNLREKLSHIKGRVFKDKFQDIGMKFGLAVYTPFGSVVDWEKGWTGRAVLTHLQLQAIFIQPTISIKLGSKFGIGGGFVYSTGSVNLQKDVPIASSTSDYGHAELSGKANGFGYNLGVYYKPYKYLSLGLTYRSQVNMKVNSGDATFTVPSSVSSNLPNGKFTASLPLPSVLTLGIGFTPTEKLSFALDVNYVGWKAYDTLIFNYANSTPTLDESRKSIRNYKNSFAFRFGGQYKITPAFAVRLGIAYVNTPIQDGYVTPETPDASRYIYTAGLGYTIKNKFTINASVLYESLKRTDTNIENQMSGTYQTNVIAPGLSLSYKF